MESEIKKLEKSQIEIKVTLSAEEMEKYKQKAAEEISKDVKVKGFRPGHVPLHVLEEHIGTKYIIGRAQELAIQMSYYELVVKEKLQVVARPEVKIEKDDPFTFTAKVATMPEIEIKDYKDIKIKKTEIKVEKKDLEEAKDELKKYIIKYTETDKPIAKGFRAELDFAGFDENGKELENTASKNHPLIVGEGSMVPGFEDAVIGMKKDEEKEFDLTFPKDYFKKDFQEKKVKFKVKATKVEEAEDKGFDEEVIEKLTGKKMSIDEFEKDLEKNILARKEQEAKQKAENEYLEELLKRTKVDLPESLIHEESHAILDDMKADIDKKGLKFEEFLTQAKTTEEELLKKYEKEAEKRIKVRLALQHVIAQEKISVDEKELNDELAKIKAHYPETEQEKIEKDFQAGELKSQIQNRLTLRKFFEKVLA
ncbi:trigger factor [Patescibacteria group bacterium]|nr:trigger factor [Patescibacteria group bacterium]